MLYNRFHDTCDFFIRLSSDVIHFTISFRTLPLSRKEQGTLRQMSSEKLIKTLPTLQNQIDALLDFDVTTNDLNNGVINAAFMLLFRDLIRLFACYNDGIINLLGMFF